MTNKTQIDADTLKQLREELKREILADLQTDEQKKEAMLAARREEEAKAREEYVKKMQESSDPWVDIRGWVETKEGVKVELDWNDAFVAYLRTNGITGDSDDQVVQKWVAMLMADMAERVTEGKGDYE